MQLIYPEGLSGNSRKDFFYNEREHIHKLKKRLTFKTKNFTLELGLWPKGHDSIFNLQLDDFSLKPTTIPQIKNVSTSRKETDNFLSRLLQINPKLKITLFTIPCLILHGQKSLLFKKNTKNNFKLNKLINLNKFKKNIEIASHGLNHYQNKSKNFRLLEFAYKSKEEIKRSLEESQNLFKKNKIFPKGFKSPAWGLGENKSLLTILPKFKFKYIVCASPFAGLNYLTKTISNLYPSYYNGLLNIPENLILSQNMKSLTTKIRKIVLLNGILTLKGHVINTIDEINKLDIYDIEKIIDILLFIKNEYGAKIGFYTLEEIAKWFDSLDKIKITFDLDNNITIYNQSNNDIAGLTLNFYKNATSKESKQISIKKKSKRKLKLKWK